MANVPFTRLPDGDGRPAKKRDLEAELEIVLERDGVPISVAPSVKPRRAQTRPPARDGEEDRIRISLIQEKTAPKRAKPVAVSFGEHEPSRHVVRMDGSVAKPKEEIRDPFHRSMHRWQMPMAEETEMGSVFVRAVDLWLEVLDPDFFHQQFTPGDPDEAYRESRRGAWSRLRRPFIRWTDRRAVEREETRPFVSAPQSAASESAFEPVVFSLPTAFVEAEPSIVELDQAEELSSEHAIEGVASANVGEQPSFEPVSFQGASAIESMPEFVAFQEPVQPKPSFRDRWSTWREEAKDRAGDLHEEERQFVEEVEAAMKTPYLEPKVRVTRVLIGFLGMFCVIALPAGAVSWSRSLTESASSARATASRLSADAGGLSSDPLELSKAFLQVGTIAGDIQQAHGLALQLSQAIPSTHKTGQTIQALLDIAQEASQSGALLSQGVERALAKDVVTPDERIVRFSQYLKEARPHLDRLFAAAHRLRPETLPEGLREKVQQGQDLLLGYETFINQAETLSNLALGVIGHDETRTYLIIFQNQAERRPSGGFMGSYAQLVLDRGVIKKLDVPGGGPYGLRSQLLPRWQPPKPVQLIASRWEFQDANWTADFPQAAETIRTFWSESGQPTLDGIIAVNATILPKLLTITGPIEMKEYGKTVTAENVIFETQKAVELEYDKEKNTPKAFVGDLNREVIARLQNLSEDQRVPLATIIAKALETKEIQINLSRPEEQTTIQALGWTGEWPKADAFDQLALIGANLAGQKSDASIQETVTQTVMIDGQGAIQTSVSLDRAHKATRGELFYGANNVQYVRLYTPASTMFLDGSGFETPANSLFKTPEPGEISFPGLVTTTQAAVAHGQPIDVFQEDGRQVFGGWIQLRPEAEKETVMSYRLAKTTADMARALSGDASLDGKTVTDAYVLRLISQSGADRTHRLTIRYPETWKVVKTADGLRVVSPGVIQGESAVLNQDTLEYVLFDRAGIR